MSNNDQNNKTGKTAFSTTVNVMRNSGNAPKSSQEVDKLCEQAIARALGLQIA